MSPEALLVEPDVPVAQVVTDEILYEAAGRGDVIVVVCRTHRRYQRVEPADEPAVEHRTLRSRNCRRRRVEAVDVGIERENRIRIVEGAEELAPYLLDPGFVELEIVPGLGIGQHVPAQRVGAVAVERLEGVDGVAEPLAHLLALLVEHQAVGNHPSVGGGAADHRMYRVKGIEPSPGLVDALGYEIGRAAEIGAVLATQAGLGVGHRARIEPDVYQVCLAHHLPAGRAHEEYVVDIRPVQVDSVVVLLTHVGRVEAGLPEGVRLHDSGSHSLVNLGIELGGRTYAQLLPAVLGTPDRKRGAPVAAAAQVPVLDVLKPFPETSGPGGLRLPAYPGIELHHLLAHCGRAYEPAVQGVVEHGLVGAPAVRVRVHVLL